LFSNNLEKKHVVVNFTGSILVKIPSESENIFIENDHVTPLKKEPVSMFALDREWVREKLERGSHGL